VRRVRVRVQRQHMQRDLLDLPSVRQHDRVVREHGIRFHVQQHDSQNPHGLPGQCLYSHSHISPAARPARLRDDRRSRCRPSVVHTLLHDRRPIYHHPHLFQLCLGNSPAVQSPHTVSPPLHAHPAETCHRSLPPSRCIRSTDALTSARARVGRRRGRGIGLRF
jgi:hypothetical protein